MNEKLIREGRVCPYCGGKPELVGGAIIYRRRPDLYEKKFWLCRGCWAYVGCHPGTTDPLGRLADSTLRSLKSRAHGVFDRLWQNGTVTRRQAYLLLADRMGLDPDEAHIGQFDSDQCRKVVERFSGIDYSAIRQEARDLEAEQIDLQEVYCDYMAEDWGCRD